MVYSKHTTVAVKINENEPLLLADMEKFLEKISPRNDDYQHNNFQIRTVNLTPDESPNGHAHLQHLMLAAARPYRSLVGKCSSASTRVCSL